MSAATAVTGVDFVTVFVEDHPALEFHGETIDSGVCHMAFFSDPDGNALMFHNRYAPKTS